MRLHFYKRHNTITLRDNSRFSKHTVEMKLKIYVELVSAIHFALTITIFLCDPRMKERDIKKNNNKRNSEIKYMTEIRMYMKENGVDEKR